MFTALRKHFLGELILWLISFACFFPWHAAYAYVDPGTGSYFIQLLIGLFVGAAYTVRHFWGNIKTWFRKRKNIKDKPD